MGLKDRLNILEKYLIFCENHTNAEMIFGYGISTLSLAIALYRMKPFAKFRKPSSIPSRFINKKVPLHGTVMQIEPTYDTLLMVDHKPLIALPRLSSSNYLPIKIAGLDVTANGISWLQTIVNGKRIIFLPCGKGKDYVNCIVSVQQNQEYINIGEELAKLGFALTTDNYKEHEVKDKDVFNYTQCLIRAQKWAQHKRNGYWHIAKHPPFLRTIQQNLSEKLKFVLSK